jgi:hypothetical protein
MERLEFPSVPITKQRLLAWAEAVEAAKRQSLVARSEQEAELVKALAAYEKQVLDLESNRAARERAVEAAAAKHLRHIDGIIMHVSVDKQRLRKGVAAIVAAAKGK